MNWKEEFKAATDILIKGGVILYPTDTIWGMGCDIFSKRAMEKIYSVKFRSKAQPLILLVSSIEMLKCFATDIPPRVEDLLSYHQKPLTVIYRKVKDIPDYLLAADGTVAIRITKEFYSKGLIDTLGRPITSTSANISGMPFPKSFGEIQSHIIEQVDFISTYKRDAIDNPLPSVIIKYEESGELDFVRN